MQPILIFLWVAGRLLQNKKVLSKINVNFGTCTVSQNELGNNNNKRRALTRCTAPTSYAIFPLKQPAINHLVDCSDKSSLTLHFLQ